MASIQDPFSGQESFKAPPAKAFAVLTDLDGLSKVIPGLVSAERVDAKTIRCVVRPGLSFIGASVKATMTLAESTPPGPSGEGGSALMQILSQGIGMSMKIESRMTIHPEPAGSRLDWTARVTEMSGLVKAAPPALVRAAADKVIKDGWAALRPKIEA